MTTATASTTRVTVKSEPRRLAITPSQTETPEAPENPIDSQQEAAGAAAMETQKLSVHYGETQTLHEVSMPVFSNAVTALIGPSGCGKSTLLRCMNRMNDQVRNAKVSGTVRFFGQDIYAREINPVRLRRHIGMVFQRSNPFPKSVFENVAYGIRLHRLAQSRSELEAMVEHSLRRVGLWDEVSDRLNANALNLSGGQQQRLCIARTIAINPEVILMDEPASALDPIATSKVEELIVQLKQHYTIVIVTHNLQQAGRISDFTAFLYMGHLIEFDNTEVIFSTPSSEYTENYITGRFG